jgi:MFS family permease
MPTIARILLSGLIGAIVCAILSFLMFFLLTVFDNQKLIEAFAYGLIVGIIGAFIGAIIGLAVGIGDLGAIGGGAVGFLGTLIIVAIYVYSTAENSSQYGYFLSESRIIFVVLSLPTILTGVITALLKKLIYKP